MHNESIEHFWHEDPPIREQPRSTEKLGRFKVKILESLGETPSDCESLSTVDGHEGDEKYIWSPGTPALLSPRDFPISEAPGTPSPRGKRNKKSRFETEILDDEYDASLRGQIGRFQLTSVSVGEYSESTPGGRKSTSFSDFPRWDAATPATPSSRRNSGSIVSQHGSVLDLDERRTPAYQPSPAVVEDRHSLSREQQSCSETTGGSGRSMSPNPSKKPRFFVEEEPSICESEESYSVVSEDTDSVLLKRTANINRRSSFELYASLDAKPQPPTQPPPPPPNPRSNKFYVSPSMNRMERKAHEPPPVYPYTNRVSLKLPKELAGKLLTDWSVLECAWWVSSLGKPYQREADIFKRYEVDGRKLYKLTKRDCDEMNFSSDLAKKKVLASRNHLVSFYGLHPHRDTAATMRQEFR